MRALRALRPPSHPTAGSRMNGDRTMATWRYSCANSRSREILNRRPSERYRFPGPHFFIVKSPVSSRASVSSMQFSVAKAI